MSGPGNETVFVDQDSKRWANLLTGYLIGFFILFELERILNIPEAARVFDWFLVIELIITEYIISHVEWKKAKWMFLFAGGMILMAVTSLIRGLDVLVNTKPFFIRGVLVLLLCPSVALLIPRNGWKLFIRIFVELWTLFYAILCVIAVNAVLSGTRIPDLMSERFIEIRLGRLYLFFFPTVSAANLTISLMMCLVGTLLYSIKVLKIYYFIKTIPMFICLGLTNGRAGYIATAVGVGLYVLCILLPYIRKIVHHSWIRIAAAILIAVAVAGICVFLNYQTVNWYNRQITKPETGSLFLSTAEGEGNNGTEENRLKNSVTNRGIINNNTLTGRDKIWKAALDLIKGDPIILLIGTSVPLMMDNYNLYSPVPGLFYHVHNILLQILLETGVTGLILAMIFLILIIRSMIRMIRNETLPLWQKTLFLPVVTGLMIEAGESLMWLGWKTEVQVIVMLFAGFTLVLGQKKDTSTAIDKQMNPIMPPKI